MSESNLTPKKILLQVSGSIAAFKSVALTSMLVKEGFEVRVILSDGANQFVGPASFEGLTGNPVYFGNFEPGKMMAHIDLERWADLILLYPASAHSIAMLATGSGQTLLGAVFLAHEFKKPYLLAPAMNQAMWKHPALKTNLETLQSWGVKILPPTEGTLACGETGDGRLIEPADALKVIQEQLDISMIKKESGLPRILVTAGGTTEPVDEVRHLRNLSSGRTGHEIALRLQKSGFPVTLVQSEYSSYREGIPNLICYSTTADFSRKLKSALSENEYDFVIHSAAVADYHVETITDGDGKVLTGTGKIQSNQPLFLKLMPNPKVIRELRTWSRNKSLKIISFKLTSDEQSDMKLESYDSEWIVQNHLKDVGPVEHRGIILKRNPDGKYAPFDRFATKNELTLKIMELLK